MALLGLFRYEQNRSVAALGMDIDHLPASSQQISTEELIETLEKIQICSVNRIRARNKQIKSPIPLLTKPYDGHGNPLVTNSSLRSVVIGFPFRKFRRYLSAPIFIALFWPRETASTSVASKWSLSYNNFGAMA